MATRLNFSAQVNAWVNKSKERQVAIFRESVQRTISLAQQYVPVDTGFLRASVRASLDSRPLNTITMTKGADGVYSYDPGAISLVILQADLGDTIYVGWTAKYAKFVEYGTSKAPPQAFVGRAINAWPRTVRAVIADARREVKANGG